MIRPRPLPVEHRTVRQRIIALLAEEAVTVRELSQRLGVRERTVVDHLTHVGRTVAGHGMRIVAHPAECMACGYVFRDRTRYTRPGRCPRCKQSHLRDPSFRISGSGQKDPTR